jgi:CDP-6-deoxy-D-xylo-4-hexulose-3-dehydrase
MRVPLASTGLRSKDIQAAVDVMNSGQLTMGEKVKAFETQMASYLGVKYFVMVNSGSSANLAIVEALLRPALGSPKLRPGDGVLVPAIAWPTTVWPLIQLGLEPVFVDVDPQTLAMDLKSAALVTADNPHVRALFPIHTLGLGIPSSDLDKFALTHDLVLINDVCESLGSWIDDMHAGTSGLAGSFSFYFSHHITTMEGGGVATNDDDFANDLKSIRSHGWSRDRSDFADWSQDLSINDSRFLFISTGFNIRPMEIQAAIGSSQLEDIDEFITRRASNATMVGRAINGDKLELVGSHVFSQKSEKERHSWMMLPILVKGPQAKFKKDEIVRFLNSKGIETRPVLTGNFLSQPALRRILGDRVSASEFPNATYVAENCFLIGNHHDFSDQQILHIIESLSIFA